VGIFRAYDGVDIWTMVPAVRRTRKICHASRRKLRGDMAMDTNTLLIIVVVIFLFGGFGFYGRGRWF
jgi:hypothetical protein